MTPASTAPSCHHHTDVPHGAPRVGRLTLPSMPAEPTSSGSEEAQPLSNVAAPFASLRTPASHLSETPGLRFWGEGAIGSLGCCKVPKLQHRSPGL